MILEISIAAAQLVDSFIRFLPFSEKASEEIKRQLLIQSILWSVASVLLYKIILANFGAVATTYKIIILLGWLPYFFIALRQIQELPQHIFVLGMAVIFSLIQHTISTMIVLQFFAYKAASDIILLEAAIYLLLFMISLPFTVKFFIKLLPSREFFDLRPQGWYIAFLPLIIVSAHLIRIADDILVHSFAERLSRIYLPLVFFFFYRYILSAAKNFYDLQRLERNKALMEDKLSELKKYHALIEKNQKKISVMRHDLRHSYNLIYTLLQNGKIKEALKHIKAQEIILEEQ